MKIKDEEGNEISVNLFTMLWYATMLPGIIGIILTIIGLLITKPYGYAVISFGAGTVAVQITAWVCWFFGTKGSPSHWMILIIAGKMIGFRGPGRFFCPRLGNMLVVIDNNERLQVQAIFGKRGKDMDGPEEVGALLGPIRHSIMVGAGLPFPEDDPLNVDTPEAEPEVSVLINVLNPIKIKRLEAFDDKTGCCKRSGISVALGQVAEDVRKGYQIAVVGKSISWVPHNLQPVTDSIKNIIRGELIHRGLHIEDTTNPSINHFGETQQMRNNINAINDAKQKGQAKVEEDKKKAEASVQEAKAVATIADAKAKAEERMADAHEKTLKAKIKPLKDAKIPNQRIADILEQEAIRLGYPRLPESITSLIYGGPSPELWKSLDQENGGAGPADKKGGGKK